MATTQITTHKNFIGGQWQESVSGRTYQVYNPARKTETVGQFQTSNLEDTAAAVAAAKEAAAGWANTPAPVRAGVLFKAIEIMGRRADEIARTITTEEGKPIADALGEVKRAMNIIEYAAGEGRRMFGYTTPVGIAQHRRLHHEASLGRGGHHHSVELPHRHSRLEDGPGAHLRQRPGVQAGLGYTLVSGEVGGSVRRGGHAPGSP